MSIESAVESIYQKKMKVEEFSGFSEQEFEKFLAKQRGIIDTSNEIILDAFAKRVEAAKKVAIAKKIVNAPLFMPQREEEILTNAVEYSKKIGIDAELGKEIIAFILTKAREIQDRYYSTL